MWVSVMKRNRRDESYRQQAHVHFTNAY
jgi:hypothetical protein